MLPSSGYFRGIACPGEQRGTCHRPYCHFRHQGKVITEKNASSPSSSSSSSHTAVSSLPVQEEEAGEAAEEKEEECKQEELECQDNTHDVGECVDATPPTAVAATPPQPETPQPQPHTSHQPTTPPAQVPKSELLQQLMSEALKKVLAENPTLASTVDASSIRIGIDPVSQESPDANKSKKQLYHRPPDTPSYNPTPIRELKKRKHSVDDVGYNPSSASANVKQGKGSGDDEKGVMGEFSSDESEEVEEKTDDFDLLEEVLAEHCKNNKVKVKKKKVKELGKLQYSLSNARKVTVDNDAMIADAKKLTDQEVKRYEVPQTDVVNKVITDGPYFLPPSPIFTSSCDGFDPYNSTPPHKKEESAALPKNSDKSSLRVESEKTESQPSTEKEKTTAAIPEQIPEQTKPTSQSENEKKVTKASGHIHLPQLVSSIDPPKLARPNVRPWTPLVRNNIPANNAQKSNSDQLDEMLELMDSSEQPQAKPKATESECQTPNQKNSENGKSPRKRYKVDLNKEIESLTNPMLASSKEKEKPSPNRDDASHQPEPGDEQDSDKRQSPKDDSAPPDDNSGINTTERKTNKRPSDANSENKERPKDNKEETEESEESDSQKLSKESDDDDSEDYKRARHRKKRKRRRSQSSSSDSEYSSRRRKKRKRSHKRHRKRNKRSRKRRNSTLSLSDQSQESEDEREDIERKEEEEEEEDDDDSEEEEEEEEEEEDDEEEEEKDDKRKGDNKSEDKEESDDSIERSKKARRHKRKYKRHRRHKRNKHKARRRKRNKSYSRSRSTSASRDSSRSRSRSSSKHRKKRNRSRHRSRNSEDEKRESAQSRSSRSRSSSQSSSKLKKSRQENEEDSKSKKEERSKRDRVTSRSERQTASEEKKAKSHSEEERSIPLPVDVSKIKREKGDMVPDLSKVKIEKEERVTEKPSDHTHVNPKENTKSRENSSNKNQGESDGNKVPEKIQERRRSSAEEKTRMTKGQERKGSTESTTDKAGQRSERRQSCDSKASDTEGSLQRKKTEERRSSTEKNKRNLLISSQPSGMSMFDLVLASAEPPKTKTLTEISIFDSVSKGSNSDALDVPKGKVVHHNAKHKSKDVPRRSSGDSATKNTANNSEQKSSSSDKANKSSRSDKASHSDTHHKHDKSESKSSHSSSSSKSKSSSGGGSGSSSNHNSSSHKRSTSTTSSSSRGSTSKHHTTTTTTSTTSTTTSPTTTTTSTTTATSKASDSTTSSRSKRTSDSTSSRSEKDASRHSSSSSSRKHSSSSKHQDTSRKSSSSSSSSKPKEDKEPPTEIAKNNEGTEKRKKKRIFASDDSDGGISLDDHLSNGGDSPLPDLSALDEISQDDWEQMLSGLDTKLDQAADGDNEEHDDPWVLAECMKVFNEFQPDHNHLENQVLPKKIKVSSEDKEAASVSNKHRVARSSSSGNLIAKKSSGSRHLKTTPMQMMVQRYQKLKEQLKKKEKELTHLQGGSSTVSSSTASSSTASSSTSRTTQPPTSSTSSSSSSTHHHHHSSHHSTHHNNPSSQASTGKSRKRIAHVPNVMGLLNAQEKIMKSSPPHARTHISPSVAKASGSIPETTAHTIAKGGKRVAHTPKTGALARPIIQPELGSLVPQKIRQRYLNALIDECKKFSSERDAFNIAAAEERVCYKRAPSRMVYLNVVVNAIKRLRTQQEAGEDAQELLDKDPQLAEKMCIEEPSSSSSAPSTSPAKSPSSSRPHPINPNHIQLSHSSVLTAGGFKGSWSIEKPKKASDCSQEALKGEAFYKHLTKYVLSEEQLGENGYPCPDPEEKGKAMVKKIDTRVKISPSALERYCDRCSVLYTVDKWGFPKSSNPCVHHWGRPYKKRKYGLFETTYSCCGGEQGADGCCQATTHVSRNYNPKNLRGYVRTISKDSARSNKEVYALDCEMCYTTEGNELTRITVISSSGDVVYEQLVKPDNPILDYNTRFSGITESDMEDVKISIREVQAALLARFSDKTILMGHSLESDLHALKIIHTTVVDTSVVFPHKMGAPYKRALKNLAAEYLKRIIQDDVSGHDSAEDAVACLHLMQWKVKEDFKGFTK